MIHYHGTPLSGPRQDNVRFLTGRHAMVSFSQPRELPVAAEVCQSFALDNGAFSAWQSGTEYDWQGFIEWVREWHKHPAFDWAVIPDSIDGTERDNDLLLSEWPRDLAHAGVPVWHPHETLERFKDLCGAYRRVAIGGSAHYGQPGCGAWWHRIRKAMDSICDASGRPPCRLHGLRLLSVDIFTKLPLSSADSINAARNAQRNDAFGWYEPPTAGQKAAVIASRIEAHNSAARWERHDQGQLFSTPALSQSSN